MGDSNRGGNTSLKSVGQDLRIGLFRFTIVPREPLLVPAVNKGNMLRGGFGHAFRKLCCVPQCRDARACPLTNACPYKIIFEPSPPPGAEQLSKNQDIPRPFVFRPQLTTQTKYQKDEAFAFELILIGRALESLPYFVLAFRELAHKGIGLNRARCTLTQVVELNRVDGTSEERAGLAGEIYNSETQLFRNPEGHMSWQWIEARLAEISINGASDVGNGPGGAIRPACSVPGRITLRFLTPTFLKAEGEAVRRPEFHHVAKRLRDRINALATFFGDGPLQMDFRGFGQRAEQVRTVSVRTEWIERARTSSKTGQRHELSGFIGVATYEGDFAEFLPWLALAELTGVGRHAALANGRIIFLLDLNRGQLGRL
jgi:hypothetical protein